MSGFLSFILVAVVAGIFGLISARHVLNEPGPLRADKIVFLPPGSDTPEMLAQLEREGVIDNPLLLNATLFVENKRGALKAGEYLFKQAVSLQEVMDELISGRQLLHAVTIPEGLTSEQIAQRLRDSDILAGDILETPKEGALLPETYKVARGYSRTKLLAKMQEDQRKLIEQIWARRSRDLPFRTPFELVTLASIVEKETGKAEERPHVAAVFVNRLRKGMRLQSDPTIVYGLVGRQGDARARHSALRARQIHALQHLHGRWIAARPDRQSRDARRSRPSPIPPIPPIFILSPTGRAAMSSRRRWISTTAMCSAGATSSRTIRRRRLPTWTIRRPASRLPRPAPAPRDQHGDAGVIGRLVLLTERHDDYPPGRTMAADDGATHRLGKFGPWPGLFAVDSLDDPTTADAKLRALAPARPTFTLASAQPKSFSGFDPTTMISAAPESNEGAGPDEAAFDSRRRQGAPRRPRRRQLPRLAARARRAESARRGTRSFAWLRPTARRTSLARETRRPTPLGRARWDMRAPRRARRQRRAGQRRSTLPKARRWIPCAINPGI